MAECFWTDMVGCQEDCQEAPDWSGIVRFNYGLIDYLENGPYKLVVGDNVYAHVLTGIVGGAEDGDAASLPEESVVVIEKIELHNDTTDDGGCNQYAAPPPPFFPDDFTASVVRVVTDSEVVTSDTPVPMVYSEYVDGYDYYLHEYKYKYGFCLNVDYLKSLLVNTELATSYVAYVKLTVNGSKPYYGALGNYGPCG